MSATMTSNVNSTERDIPKGGLTPTEVFFRRAQENPLVPIGILVTCMTLGMAFRSRNKGNKATMNHWLRARIAAQGFTVVAMVGGSYYLKNKAMEEEKNQEQTVALEKEMEKRAFEDRIKAAEETYRLEQSAKSPAGSEAGNGGAGGSRSSSWTSWFGRWRG